MSPYYASLNKSTNAHESTRMGEATEDVAASSCHTLFGVIWLVVISVQWCPVVSIRG